MHMSYHDPHARRGRPPVQGTVLLALLVAGCSSAAQEPAASAPDPARTGPSVVQAGAPGEGSRAIADDEEMSFEALPHTRADVRFMQHMIEHHRQALVMSRLVEDRTDNGQIVLLARRIDRSQDDEIGLMTRWLEARDEPVPAPGEHGSFWHFDPETGEAGGAHAPDEHDADHATGPAGEHELMAGMLSLEQLRELADARGAAFDRLFVEYMIQHHGGALTMVDELFASPGAGQDSEMYQFASHVDSDQRIEIGRMERMLQTLADAR